MIPHVIILCQGSQSRLPELLLPKQLLKLSACADAPILDRTILQVMNINANSHITVVGWDDFVQHYANTNRVKVHTLKDPGNSSLKGLYRYLMESDHDRFEFQATIVLFGDCVYSWRCLRAVMDGGLLTDGRPVGLRFVGTTTLSRSDGELWGCGWTRNIHVQMVLALGRALEKHPPSSVDMTYQPGQMRRLLWEIDASYEWMFGRRWDKERWWFVPCDDYTKDIDTPPDLLCIDALSAAAALDDKEHGFTW